MKGNLTISNKLWLSAASLLTTGIVVYLVVQKMGSLTPSSTAEAFANSPATSSIAQTEVTDATVEDDQDDQQDDHPEPSPYERLHGVLNYAAETTGMSSSYQEGFTEGLSLDDFTKPFRQIGDFFKMIGKLGERIARFARSFIEFGEGAMLMIKNLGEIAVITIGDVFQLCWDSFACFLTFITNFRQCIVFWVLDFVLHLLKSLFLTFPLYVIQVLTDLDLQEYVDMIVEWVLVPIDELCYDTIGYHFMHFPDWVIRDCYTCNLMHDFHQIGDDFGPHGRLAELFWKPVSLFIKGGEDFMSLFAPL
jgi:hypothetical protein